MAFTNSLKRTKENPNDEYYTQYIDIELELSNYHKDLKDKVIYCNCDDYRKSNFVKYLKDNFHIIGIKRLIATNYDNGDGAYRYDYDGTNESIERYENSGSYDTEENLKILNEEADVVITNPPFSKYKEYLKTLIDSQKKFIIIASVRSITYHSVFPYLMNNKINIGYNDSPTGKGKRNNIKYIDGNSGELKDICSFWYTNFHIDRPFLVTEKKYKEEDYEVFDNAPDIIEVGKRKDIPMDYFGLMAIPITTLVYINRDQYEIVGKMAGAGITDFNKYGNPYINGKMKFARVIIRQNLAKDTH